ncbi:hypothetical protein NP493_1065g01010 [Ridgeia piscesae]|uniref:Phospholipase A2-like central domain-containing protein n=1 Tax=Ridgeia piscesae TaxID=27915 RepID=A0AAD9NK22_RIDPI|nr:hypothetical protein NP493_1065g01010 [Ridgeia piscesae]
MKLVSSAALLLSWLALLSGCRGAGEVDGPLTDVRVRHGTLTVREATDGRRQVRAVFDAADTLVDCEVGETKAGASSDIAVEKTIVGGPAVKLLHARCLQLHQTAARTRRSLLVYPGTKWCGKGSSAHFYDDLGDSRDTDMCCRAHDFCPFTISGLTSKYNLFNYRFHTLSHCDCDDRLRTCLDSVKSDVIAPIVRSLYFSIAGNDCFVLKPEKVCVKRSWWGKCQKYMKTYRAVYRQ